MRFSIGRACASVDPLSARGAEVERIEKPVEPDYILKIVLEVGGTKNDSIVPKRLRHPRVEAANFFRIEIEVVPENLVLTGRRTEARRVTRMQDRVGRLDLVAARKAIGPDAAELIEVIVAPARDQVQAFARSRVRQQENRRSFV